MLRDGWWRVWRAAITGATVALVLAVGFFVTVGIPKLSAHANAHSATPAAHPSTVAAAAPIVTPPRPPSPSDSPSPPPSPAPPPAPPPPPPSPPPTARTTAAGTVWLCRPGLTGNPCAADLAATSVAAGGARTPLAAQPAAAPRFDCFYAYPTVSLQAGPNANLNVDPQETAIAISQASRFSQVCNVWAPIYAQRTKVDQPPGFDPNAAAEVAYESLRSAWRDYMANFNNGRPVVIIGHSQGAIVLARLIGAEVDPNPAVRRLVVSALLVGGNVGGFPNMPACRSPGQTGCVIAYSSYYEAPPPDSIFGRLGGLCTNPASLGGGAGTLQPFQRVANAWVTYPGLYTASCVSADGATWLEVTPAPGDPRPRIPENLGPAWGLHESDVNLALGNLVADVAAEEAAYR